MPSRNMTDSIPLAALSVTRRSEFQSTLPDFQSTVWRLHKKVHRDVTASAGGSALPKASLGFCESSTLIGCKSLSLQRTNPPSSNRTSYHWFALRWDGFGRPSNTVHACPSFGWPFTEKLTLPPRIRRGT